MAAEDDDFHLPAGVHQVCLGAMLVTHTTSNYSHQRRLPLPAPTPHPFPYAPSASPTKPLLSDAKIYLSPTLTPTLQLPRARVTSTAPLTAR